MDRNPLIAALQRKQDEAREQQQKVTDTIVGVSAFVTYAAIVAVEIELMRQSVAVADELSHSTERQVFIGTDAAILAKDRPLEIDVWAVTKTMLQESGICKTDSVGCVAEALRSESAKIEESFWKLWVVLLDSLANHWMDRWDVKRDQGKLHFRAKSVR